MTMFDDSDTERVMRTANAVDDDVTAASIYQTAVSNGQSALKALLILNGGAAIAFLSFMGVAIQRAQLKPDVLEYFVFALWGFIFGAFAAVLSAGAIFLTNCCSYKNWTGAANFFFGVTCLIGLLAFAGFVYGGVEATAGFRAAAATLAAAGCPTK
jgi:hypothetical protein